MEKTDALPARNLEELGAEVTKAREGKKLSIEDVALATCIRRNFLEDIEKGDFSKFKARVYARGFVHAYIDFVGAGDLWDEYSELLTEAVLAPARSEPRRTDKGVGRRVSMQPPASAVAPTHGFRFSSLRRNCIILICIIVIAALAGLIGNWDRINEEITRIQNRRAYDGMVNASAEKAQHEQKKKAAEHEAERAVAAVARAKEAQAKAEAEAEAEKTDALSEDENASRAASDAPAAPRAEAPAAPAAPQMQKIGAVSGKALRLRATGECWIQINRGREILISTTVGDGWEAAYELDEPLLVRLGNAQEISLSTDGENFTQLTGGVVRYEVRPDGTMRRVVRRTE